MLSLKQVKKFFFKVEGLLLNDEVFPYLPKLVYWFTGWVSTSNVLRTYSFTLVKILVSQSLIYSFSSWSSEIKECTIEIKSFKISFYSLKVPLIHAHDIDFKMLILYNCNHEKCKSNRYLHQSQSTEIMQFLYNSELYVVWALIVSELLQEFL